MGQFECEMCHKVFGRKQSLLWHLKLKHSDPSLIKFNCEYCSVGFLVKSIFDGHLQKCRVKKKLEKETEKKLRTDEKNCRINKKLEIKAVKKSRTDEPKTVFECDICKMLFESKQGLSKHMQFIHNPNVKKMKCDKCGLVFINELVFGRDSKNRRRKCHKECIPCNVCNRMFSSKITLRTHRARKHCLPGTRVCKSCVRKFSTVEALDNHRSICRVKNYHQMDAKKVFECFMCHKIYKSKESLRIHLLHVHSPHGKQFKCEPCNRSKTDGLSATILAINKITRLFI